MIRRTLLFLATTLLGIAIVAQTPHSVAPTTADMPAGCPPEYCPQAN